MGKSFPTRVATTCHWGISTTIPSSKSGTAKRPGLGAMISGRMAAFRPVPAAIWCIDACAWPRDCHTSRVGRDARSPVHSYRLRLHELDDALFDHAWTNRIFRILRRSHARLLGQPEDRRFGPLPAGSLALTHDVDALDKTGAIRLKQSLFALYNVLRLARTGAWSKAGTSAREAARVALTTPRYNWLEETARLAAQAGIRSTFHLYGRRKTGLRSPRTWLFDPAYHPNDTRLVAFVAKASERGFEF